MTIDVKSLRASGYSWDEINDMIATEMQHEEEMEVKAKEEAEKKAKEEEEKRVKELEKASHINETRTDVLNALALYLEANGVELDEETRVMLEGMFVELEKMIEGAEVKDGVVKLNLSPNIAKALRFMNYPFTSWLF